MSTESPTVIAINWQDKENGIPESITFEPPVAHKFIRIQRRRPEFVDGKPIELTPREKFYTVCVSPDRRNIYWISDEGCMNDARQMLDAAIAREAKGS